jgi:hypothetical protein
LHTAQVIAGEAVHGTGRCVDFHLDVQLSAHGVRAPAAAAADIAALEGIGAPTGWGAAAPRAAARQG